MGRVAISLARRYYSGGGVALTADRYPWVTRAPHLSRIEDKHVAAFERLLGPSGVITEEEQLDGYNTDWLKMVRGQSKVVLRPKTVEEVSAVMRSCSEGKLAVCPQGGNTGLVGGSVPVFDEIVLSMSLMNNIIKVDPVGGNVWCEAGCVLEAVNTHLEKFGLMMPYDLGAKGSCQVGGNVSTCAGGLRLVRYGSLNANLLGVQAVLANGDILDCMSGHRKDNTGYHLRQLFLGAEGTLGIVTGAVISCPTLPTSVSLACLGLDDFSKVLTTLRTSKRILCETLSSCEVMDDTCMDAVANKLGLKPPLGSHKFYMLVETHASNPQHDGDKMDAFLQELLACGDVEDGTVASEPSKMNALWQIRERITEALSRDGYLYKYDLSLPHEKFYEIVHVMRNRLRGVKAAKTVSGFGHVGDGNLHLNVEADAFDQEILEMCEPFIFDWTQKNGGSISAEHGIGFKKAKFMGKYAATGKASLSTMRAIKTALDPNGILNPYKVLPPA
ncbi:hypothetical protein AAG570_005186 [Ranatra chinensis]|uniref:D-2-hydroxyglutarate dehydrogenase, mitochondrial n=1 Tax=Ranatra chinensis TaxID=642074 RepID=A0ABD0YLI2_9HEMI